MKIANLLIDLGLSTKDSIQLFREGTRDRGDIRVFRCERSGVIFLESDDHISAVHYEQMQQFDYWGAGTRADALRETVKDDTRRAKMLGSAVKNKRWLDVGTGAGGILDLIAPVCAEAAAVELQPGARAALQDEGYNVFRDLNETPEAHFDIITLFHVLEHVPQPIELLRAAKPRLAPGGRVYIEVPHARDFLIGFLACEPFIKFTLWSEHLMLHTRESLRCFAAASGFGRCKIVGLQRHPLANHLYWLAKGKPGGHEAWSILSSHELDDSYEAMLNRLNCTDTLLAYLEI